MSNQVHTVERSSKLEHQSNKSVALSGSVEQMFTIPQAVKQLGLPVMGLVESFRRTLELTEFETRIAKLETK